MNALLATVDLEAVISVGQKFMTETSRNLFVTSELESWTTHDGWAR